MIESFFQSLAGMTMISTAIAAAALSLFFSIKRRGTSEDLNWVRILAVSVFVGYMAGLFGLTLELPTVFSEGFRYSAEHNLIPFKQIIGWFGYLSSVHTNVNLWGNILLFIPVGFGVLMLESYNRPVLAGIAWTALVSLFIELFQLFTPRTTDIDDIILNTLGGLIGVLLYLLFKRFFEKADKRLKEPVLYGTKGS